MPEVIFFIYKTEAKTSKIANGVLRKASKYFSLAGINSCVMDIKNWNESINCKISIGLGGDKPTSKRGKITGDIIRHQAKQRNKHIVIDRGYIYKRNEYWSVGWDGLNGRADFRNKNSDNSRIKEWGIKLSPWSKSNDGHVLFCLQLPWDAAVSNTNYAKYTEDTINTILKSTDRDVIIREHPLINKGRGSTLDVAKRYKDSINKILKLKRVYKSDKKTIEEDFKNTWCVVSYNSNSTVEATIHGIPSFVKDKGSMTWGISSHDLDIENPLRPERDQWFYDISYSQWSEQEISSGVPFRQLGVKEYLDDD